MNRIDLVMSTAQPAVPRVDVVQSDDELKAVTREFESLLLHQLIKSMRRTVPESPLTSHGERIFRDMLDMEYARRIAQAGGIGLADILYKSLSGSSTRPGDIGSTLNILADNE